MRTMILLLVCVLMTCPVRGQDVPSETSDGDGNGTEQAVAAAPAPTIPGLHVEDAELYRLAPLEHLFTPDEFQWERVPHVPVSGGGIAVRTGLNRKAPLVVEAERPGYLYAVLWLWDFGFFPHGPADLAEINGWELINSDEPRVKAPEPFATVRPYRRGLSVGRHELTLTEYFGQWVIVGFGPAEGASGSADVPRVELADARTRHNVFDPHAAVVATTTQPIVDMKLYHKGKLVDQFKAASFPAPQKPGRYLLRVAFKAGSRVLPLTVGYGPCTEPGWPDGFFPIHFYGGWGYRGVFSPNGAVLGDLTKLSQFEMGANTFFTHPEKDELPDALGARRILLVKRHTRWAIRSVPDEAKARRQFLGTLESLKPYSPNIIGFYVEDEPGEEYGERMKIMEEAFQASDPGLCLLYCMGSWSVPKFWDVAGSSARMIRVYPIRKKRKDDLLGSVREDLAEAMITWQSRGYKSPLWFVTQTFGDSKTPGIWSVPTPTQARLMVNLALGRGMKALTYFCYDSSPTGKEDLHALVRWPYVPDCDTYYEIVRLNDKMQKVAPLLSSWEWVERVPQKTEGFDVQLLQTRDGRKYAWVTNFSFDQARQGTVDLPGIDGGVEVSLEPADSKLIELDQR